MRTFPVRLIATACLAVMALPLMTHAQQPAEAPPPPKLQPLEEGEPPEVTIRPPEQQRRITETRAPGGKVTEIKVSTGGSTYILKANDPAGDGQQASALRGAQWEVLEFDLRRAPQQKAEGEAEAGAVPADAGAPPAPPENTATNKPANR